MSGPSSPVRKPKSKSAKAKAGEKQTTLAFGQLASSSASSSSASSRKMKPLGKLTQFSFAVPEVPAHRRQPQSTATSSQPASSTSQPRPAQTTPSSSTTIGRSKRKADVIEVSSGSDEDDNQPASRPPLTNGKGNKKANAKGKQKATALNYDEGEDDAGPGLWTDLYAPQTASDLAVNKTKITEVRAWLEEAVPASDPTRPPSKLLKYRRILALSGPSGVGKTATVRALASELGLEVVEWVEGNEENGIGGDFGAVSLISRFKDFLDRVRGTHSLSFDEPSSSTQQDVATGDETRKILLLDDLPNLSHAPTRAAFQEALLEFAISWTPHSCPLVVVVTDPGDGGRASESWMDHRRGDGWDLRSVLGVELTDGAYTRAISFNPIAPTFLTKALTRTLALACPTASSRPPKEAVELIVHSANGDIRSAINALEFLCKLKVVNSGAVKAKGAVPKTGKGSRGGKGGKTTAGDGLKKLYVSLGKMEAVTRREQSLALFHALGKVLYNKRWGDPDDDDAEPEPKPSTSNVVPLPSHLDHKDRRRSKVDVEALFVDAPVDTSLYSLYLHQNYPLFCDDVDECFDAVEALSGSDAMRTDEDLWQSSPISIAYAFNLTVRGLLAGLPSPIVRRGQKMYKPDWFDTARKQRANEEGVSEVGGWCAGLGIASSGGGQLSRQALTSQVIPQLRHLAIPPTYPATLPPLSSLPYLPAQMTRSMRAILSATDAPDEHDQAEVDEDGVELQGARGFYTEREEVEVGDEEGQDGQGAGEEEEDAVEEWTD